MNRNEKILLFKHIHNSGTCSGHNLNFVITTANGHKQKILLQATITVILVKSVRGEELKHN